MNASMSAPDPPLCDLQYTRYYSPPWQTDSRKSIGFELWRPSVARARRPNSRCDNLRTGSDSASGCTEVTCPVGQTSLRSHNEASELRRHAPPATRGGHRTSKNGLRRLRAEPEVAPGDASAHPAGVSRDLAAGGH